MKIFPRPLSGLLLDLEDTDRVTKSMEEMSGLSLRKNTQNFKELLDLRLITTRPLVGPPLQIAGTRKLPNLQTVSSLNSLTSLLVICKRPSRNWD